MSYKTVHCVATYGRGGNKAEWRESAEYADELYLNLKNDPANNHLCLVRFDLEVPEDCEGERLDVIVQTEMITLQPHEAIDWRLPVPSE